MNRRRRGIPARRSGGFTLLEIVLATTLGVLVAGGSLALLEMVRRNARTEVLRLDLQQNARFALEMIGRDLQVAGQGMDPSARFGVVSVADGGGGQSDTLYLLYMHPDAPAHAVTHTPAPKKKSEVKLLITCDDPVDDLAAGDFLYLASGSARGVALINDVSRSLTGVSCDTGNPPSIGRVTLDVSPVNAERHGWVLEANENGAVAAKVRAIAYFQDRSDPEDPRLVRATALGDAGWIPTPIADFVTDFEVELLFRDGTVASGADGDDADPENDYDDINSVNIRFEVAARWRDKDMNQGQLLKREYATSVTPRNQLYTRNLE